MRVTDEEFTWRFLTPHPPLRDPLDVFVENSTLSEAKYAPPLGKAYNTPHSRQMDRQFSKKIRTPVPTRKDQNRNITAIVKKGQPHVHVNRFA